MLHYLYLILLKHFCSEAFPRQFTTKIGNVFLILLLAVFQHLKGSVSVPIADSRICGNARAYGISGNSYFKYVRIAPRRVPK